MALRKVESGRFKNFDQNTQNFSRKDGIWGAKLPLGKLTAKKSTLVPFYVKCCTTYFNANSFGLFVGLVALEMFHGLHFLGKTAKKWVVAPQKWLLFSRVRG